jgi:hypothetical protein
MKTLILAAVAALALGGAAQAADDCNVPMNQWQPREAVAQLAMAKGWTVARIKTDDGCYELRGTDADGHGIKVKLDPGTLAVVEMKTRYRK